MTGKKPKPLTINQIVAQINELTGYAKNQIKEILDEYEKILLVDLAEKQEAKLGNLGKIKIKVRQTRVGNNPATGEKVVIPGKAVPKFAFSKAIKEFVADEFSPLLDIDEVPNTITEEQIID